MIGAGAYGVAAAAGVAAGGINALAGGGSVISFPALQYVGLPSLTANVTNIVALTPGYMAGSVGQRADLAGQGQRLRDLAAIAGSGGLAGSVLLVTVAAHTFSIVVPYLLLLACGSLALQVPARRLVERRRARRADAAGTGTHRRLERLGVLVCSVYGGFFGAGLGIMLLAVLGLFSEETLLRNNALKQVLSLVVSLLAAVALSASGRVTWAIAAVLAAASLVGGFLGGRAVRHLDPNVLRVVVVCYGVAAAIHSWA